ncbi:E3 ubiquitin-protein ligase RNF114-like [Rhopilema esculentum]|uniref:E3 ubiquitin-protein ligase RNF114-like n=1 Tax=Rhopilema esculentum TaxID=499914 RepID=UPI0031D6A422
MASAVRRRSSRQIQDKSSDFLCSICREILKSPYKLPCSHIFCHDCISMSSQDSCPYCRQNFNPMQMRRAIEVEQKIKTESAKCEFCEEKILLRHMQHHLDDCGDSILAQKLDNALQMKGSKDVERANPSSELGMATGRSQSNQGQLKTVPALFDCPCCSVRRLDRESLLEHVLAQHRTGILQVVCPICASMPWGDRNYKSVNFLAHINLRHQFDYDRFVDMNQNEDELLKNVIYQSMYDQ